MSDFAIFMAWLMACYMVARIQGACDPSCSERHPCGVLGCPSSPFIDPPAVIEPETGSLLPSGTTGALEETSPLITAANESHVTNLQILSSCFSLSLSL